MKKEAMHSGPSQRDNTSAEPPRRVSVQESGESSINRSRRRSLITLRDTLLSKILSAELPVPAALTATQEALASVQG